MSHSATSFRAYLKELRLEKDFAVRAQRTGAMPDKELHRAFQEKRKENDLLSFIGAATYLERKGTHG